MSSLDSGLLAYICQLKHPTTSQTSLQVVWLTALVLRASLFYMKYGLRKNLTARKQYPGDTRGVYWCFQFGHPAYSVNCLGKRLRIFTRQQTSVQLVYQLMCDIVVKCFNTSLFQNSCFCHCCSLSITCKYIIHCTVWIS